MAKGRNILWKPIKGKWYKNSECEICECYLCVVKAKEINGEIRILCRECFKKNQEKKK